jgi:hypothetical protein
LTTTVAADELTNLAHERGVCYAFVDGDGEVLDPQEVGDGNQELTDRMSRTGGATAQRALRVRFDFTTSITPRAVIIDRQWKANELGVGLDRVRILVGNSPDSLAEVLTEEAIGGDYARENKAVRLDLPKTDGRYVQVEIEAAGKFTIREIEVLGPKEDSRAIAAAPSTMLSNSGLDPVGNLDQLAAIGAIVLSHDLSEAQVRKMLAGAKANSVFVIPTGASWLLTDTLVIPDEVTVIGFHGGRSGTFTFKKGFDGPLAHVGSWVTLHGISFDGNRDEGFQGDGLVDPAGKGLREQKFVRVEVRNCAGHGFVFAVPHYYSIYQFCTFDRNGGYGAVYGQVRSHHTDNVWDSCHFGWNGQGGIAFHGVEASSVWENCEFFHNGGAAFDHFLIHKKSGPGKPIAPQPQVGAGALVIRNSVIRNHAGPVWLNRDGTSEERTHNRRCLCSQCLAHGTGCVTTAGRCPYPRRKWNWTGPTPRQNCDLRTVRRSSLNTMLIGQSIWCSAMAKLGDGRDSRVNRL